jgi:hypothetical protein
MKRKMEGEEAEELDATFTDERGTKWRPRLTLKIVDRFCRETGAPSLDLFAVSAAELLDLVFAGIQYQTLFEAAPFSRDEFLDRLDGPSYEAALAAGRNAIGNFILRCRLPNGKRGDGVKALKTWMTNPDQDVERRGNALLAMLRGAAALEASRMTGAALAAGPGPGPTSSGSPESPAPVPQATA